MEVYIANEGREESWVYRIYSSFKRILLTVSQSACISPLLLSGGDSTEPPSALRLDIGEFEAEPFSVSNIAYDEIHWRLHVGHLDQIHGYVWRIGSSCE